MRTLPYILFVLIFTGCSIRHKQPVVVTPSVPLAPEVAREKIVTDSTSKAVASIKAARTANAANPDGAPKTLTEGELNVAQENLPASKPEDDAEALARVNAGLKGDLKSAQAGWEKALKIAGEYKDKLAKADADLKEARAKADADLKKVLADKDAEIAAAKNAAKNAVLKDQVFYLNIGGGVFLALFGVCSAFGGILFIQRGGWVLLLLSFLAFGMAQIVGQNWFLWAVLGCILLAAGSFAFIAWKKHSVTAAAEAFKPVVSVLDQAYESAAPEVKEILDAHVFNPLSNLMDRAEKATVRLIRNNSPSNQPKL